MNELTLKDSEEVDQIFIDNGFGDLLLIADSVSVDLSSIYSGSANYTDVESFVFRIISCMNRDLAYAKDCYYNQISKDELAEAINNVEKSHAIAITSLLTLNNYVFIKDTLNASIAAFDTAYVVFRNSIVSPLDFLKSLGPFETTSRNRAFKTYFIKHLISGFIKIGKSTNPSERIKALRTGAGSTLILLAVINDDVELELHKKFAEFNVGGEWFVDKNKIIENYAIGIE